MSKFEKARKHLEAFQLAQSYDQKLFHAEEFLSVLSESYRETSPNYSQYVNLFATGMRIFRSQIESILNQEMADMEGLYFSSRLIEAVDAEGCSLGGDHDQLKMSVHERLRELVKRIPEIRALAEIKSSDELDIFVRLMTYSETKRAQIIHSPKVREKVQELQKFDDEFSWACMVEALACLKGWSFGETQSALKSFPPEKRNKVLANPKVRDLARKIREKAESTPATNLDDLLADGEFNTERVSGDK